MRLRILQHGDSDKDRERCRDTETEQAKPEPNHFDGSLWSRVFVARLRLHKLQIEDLAVTWGDGNGRFGDSEEEVVGVSVNQASQEKCFSR